MMGHPTRQTFEQLLNAKKCDEILASVTRCIWEADTRQGEPPIPSLKQIQETTGVVEKYKDVSIVPEKTVHLTFTESEDGTLTAPFELEIKGGRLNPTGDNVSQKKIGDIYLYKIEGVQLEDIGVDSVEAFQKAMETLTAASVLSDAVSAYFMKTAGEPDDKKVEWAHQVWKERRTDVETLAHPLTQVVREWIKKIRPSVK